VKEQIQDRNGFVSSSKAVRGPLGLAPKLGQVHPIGKLETKMFTLLASKKHGKMETAGFEPRWARALLIFYFSLLQL
jgi:hypothetical protein